MKKIIAVLFILICAALFSSDNKIYLEKYIKTKTKYYTDINKSIALGELQEGEKVIILKEINEKYYYIKSSTGRMGYIDKTDTTDEKRKKIEAEIKILKELKVYTDIKAKEYFDIVYPGEKFQVVNILTISDGRTMLETTENIYIEGIEGDYILNIVEEKGEK